MMKKVMFVVVMLLVASTCFAQLQSPPSNVTGYVKITAVANGFTPFGLPFKFWDVPAGGIPSFGIVSTDPSDIVGDQTTCGAFSGVADLIWRQDNGDQAFRTCANVWQGALQTNSGMVPGEAFWYRNRTASNRNLVLAGEVDNSGNYGLVTMNENGFTEYSWRDSRNVDRSQLNLLTSGFTGGAVSGASDQVWEQGGAGNIFWRRTTDNTWQGLLVTVDPGRAYWVFNRNHANDSWSYNYNPGGALLTNDQAPVLKDNGAPISRMNTGTAKTKGVSRTHE
jgi:hypothetical protein